MAGNYASGRTRGSGRNRVERYLALDVNQLHSAGCLCSGWEGSWQWSHGGQQIAAISLRLADDRLHLDYSWSGEDVSELVRISRVRCRFGGTRPYFECPGGLNGTFCGRHVAKLHGAGRYFLCRHCYQLRYQSQFEAKWVRTLRRARKIERSLSGLSLEKPKDLRKYEKVLDQVLEADMLAAEAFAGRIEKLLAWADKEQSQQP
ncbi:MAG: hypothetical protein JO212_19250 [Acetobacteraceae bacterium]|nr:hypothetical protein [Acetobacteraceae bacterium]